MFWMPLLLHVSSSQDRFDGYLVSTHELLRGCLGPDAGSNPYCENVLLSVVNKSSIPSCPKN